MNKRKMLSIILLGLLATGAVSAILVNYLSNTIEENITVESPIALEGTEFDLEITYGGEDGFALVKIVNRADMPITGDVNLVIGPDTVGISTAVTEDINYCFSSQGDMSGITSCETDYLTWMLNNIDWNDWVANTAYSDTLFPSALVVNTNGDSFTDLGGYTGNTLVLPDQTIPADTTTYGVIYVATDPALTPGTYTFDLTVVP